MSNNATEIRQGNQYTLTESGRNINDDWFDPEKLRHKDLLQGEAQGRGNAWFVRLENTDCVLRHYYRGGAMAKLLHDRYIWTGLARTRAWQEWHLLAKLRELNLAVPLPIAAKVQREGLFYRADLITQQIPATQTLAQRLAIAPLTASLWRRIGKTIANFHNKSLWHADLNARNILINHHDKVFLIDFDKAKIRLPNNKWPQDNLQRLSRSLHKINNSGEPLHFDADNWKQLVQGYETV
ncbi:MAG: 3-deoxy-D-manno-octulosonic acid kinase [Thiothrix sp.]|nr:MAG: 3-deoxy-D-manno-octulosonic acid kinase [Thiothrix sp.]